MNRPKIICIVGPTSSGKSDLAIEIARTFHGEVISADSRQVYKGLDIGTGKITKREMRGIPHHLLDVASPRRRFTVAEFKQKSEVVINDILSRGKLPILCGGTGFYIQSIVDGITPPEVPLNKKLRIQLEKETTEKLAQKLQKLDLTRFSEIDTHNRPRLIRAIEIATALGHVPKQIKNPLYDVLQIGIKTDKELLNQKINERLKKRLRAGMVAEVEHLHKKGLSWKRMETLGLEYRYLSRFLRKKISRTEMITQLETAIHQYAKRQMTWFKKDMRINWIQTTKESEGLVRDFCGR